MTVSKRCRSFPRLSPTLRGFCGRTERRLRCAGGKRAANEPSHPVDAVAYPGHSGRYRDLLYGRRFGPLVRLRAVHGGGIDRLARWTCRATVVAAIRTR